MTIEVTPDRLQQIFTELKQVEAENIRVKTRNSSMNREITIHC